MRKTRSMATNGSQESEEERCDQIPSQNSTSSLEEEDENDAE
jgi:hypothetical protein